MSRTFLKEEWLRTYMQIAIKASFRSKAERKQVGCLFVLENGLMAIGINGTPAGWNSNVCESEGETMPEVLHAEENALAKLMNSTLPTTGASVFVTTCPCRNCAKLLIAAKVKAVYYLDDHREMVGLDLLLQAGIAVYRAAFETEGIVFTRLNVEPRGQQRYVCLIES